MAIAKKDLPAYVRRCWRAAQNANKENRDAEIRRLKFYAADDQGNDQWDPDTVRQRVVSGRPMITVNKCKPPVDQIEGDIRMNPPGPAVFPVGGGADGDTADIMEGLIREVLFRCDANVCFSTAGKYVAASGCGYIELGTEYESDRTRAQRVTIHSVEDPAVIFMDPKARMANRQDAMWAGKLKRYSREEYIAVFGEKRRVLKSTAEQSTSGWIQDAMGGHTDNDSKADYELWAGKGGQDFYVAEFSWVEFNPTKVTMGSDSVGYYEDEEVPEHVTLLEGDDNTWTAQRRTIKNCVVDAMEVIDETDWYGSLHRWIPVLGPEVYIEGKLKRMSLISGAMSAQQALNFVVTSLSEVTGYMPKTPWVGWEGQFQNPNWRDANTEIYAYLEVTPTFADDGNGNKQFLPAPQRNMWAAEVEWLISAYGMYSDSIKSITNTYDPSLGAQKGDQSGKAIEQLRSESNVGNFSYADNLHRAIGVAFRQMIEIFPKIYDGPRVVTIVRPDNEHETVQINKLFPGGKAPKGEKAFDITTGEHGVRATVGATFETARREARELLIEFAKIDPLVMKIPGFAANLLRLIGDGDDKVQQMADAIDPKPDQDVTPAQLQMQLQQLGQQNQQLKQLAQDMHAKLISQLPKLEVDRFKAILDNVTKIRVAEITASKDLDRADADRMAAQLETEAGLAHDMAMTVAQHAHERVQQEGQQQHAAATQASDQSAAAESQESAQQASAEQQQAAQQAAQQQAKANQGAQE